MYAAQMKILTRAFPLIAAGLLGWVAVFPPDWLAAMGWLRFPLAGGVVFVLLLALVVLIVADDLKMSQRIAQAESQSLPNSLILRVDEYEKLGFVQAGPVIEAGESPATFLIPLVHETERIYGSVFRIGGSEGRVTFDVFSFFSGLEGGLASSIEPGSAMLPAEPSAFHQVIAGANVAQLLTHHRAALTFLAERGLEMRHISTASFVSDLTTAIERHRRHFLAKPLRHALITVWRSASRVTPHLGPLEKQPGIEKYIERLRVQIPFEA